MKCQRILAVLFVVALALGAALSAGALTAQNQTGPGSPSDDNCYCGINLCGCSPAGPGYTLTATCSCGATCTRSCTYSSAKGS